jgi:type II secretory pathway predicted ATPase ExeA
MKMDVTQQSRESIQNGAHALGSAADKVKRGAGWVADNAGDLTDSATHGLRRFGSEVSSVVTRRPVESGLVLAGIGCLLAGFFIGRSRYRDFG